jgi:hypothetical protein
MPPAPDGGVLVAIGTPSRSSAGVTKATSVPVAGPTGAPASASRETASSGAVQPSEPADAGEPGIAGDASTAADPTPAPERAGTDRSPSTPRPDGTPRDEPLAEPHGAAIAITAGYRPHPDSRQEPDANADAASDASDRPRRPRRRLIRRPNPLPPPRLNRRRRRCRNRHRNPHRRPNPHRRLIRRPTQHPDRSRPRSRSVHSCMGLSNATLLTPAIAGYGDPKLPPIWPEAGPALLSHARMPRALCSSTVTGSRYAVPCPECAAASRIRAEKGAVNAMAVSGNHLGDRTATVTRRQNRKPPQGAPRPRIVPRSRGSMARADVRASSVLASRASHVGHAR